MYLDNLDPHLARQIDALLEETFFRKVNDFVSYCTNPYCDCDRNHSDNDSRHFTHDPAAATELLLKISEDFNVSISKTSPDEDWILQIDDKTNPKHCYAGIADTYELAIVAGVLQAYGLDLLIKQNVGDY